MENFAVGAIKATPDIPRHLISNETKLMELVLDMTSQLKVKDERIVYLTNLLLSQNQTEEKVTLPQSPSGPMQQVTSPAHKWQEIKTRLERKFRKVPSDDTSDDIYNEELAKADAELASMGSKV